MNKLNTSSLNFNADLTADELKRIKRVKEDKLSVGGYIRIITDDLLAKIGSNLENINKFFPDESKREGYSFGEIYVGEKNVKLIKRIKKEWGISRKQFLRKSFDLAFASKDKSPEKINPISIVKEK